MKKQVNKKVSIVSKIAEKAAEKVVAHTALEAAASALDKASKGIDKIEAKKQAKEERKVAELKASNPNHTRLHLVQERGHFKELYHVYDEAGTQKYLIKGELLSQKHHLHVYDASGRIELGMAKEKLLALRSPLSFDSDPKNFELFVSGKALGKMKTKASVGKRKFHFDFNDWTVEGDFLRNTYQIRSGNTLIMTVTEKIGTWVYDPYILDIMDRSNEFLCLLIAVVIDAAQSSKKNETEFAKKQLKRELNPFKKPYE